MHTWPHRLVVALAILLGGVIPAAAQDRLCDPGDEDCRAILLNYIRNERVAIDVAFWFMEDARYTNELIRKHNEGVAVRVLIDTRANSTHPLNAERLQELQNAGIPMRRRLTSYILHWKMMLFHGQNVVEFSGANYSANAWVPLASQPYENYIDEAIYFTSDTAIVDSFRTKFDDQWVDTANWADYANIAGPLARRYDVLPKDPSLNFPPAENFRSRSISLYRAEPEWIDVIIYRITDRQHTDNILAAVSRGVPVRLITEPKQYRDPTRLWHSWNVDRLHMGGVQIKHRAHAGLNHQKSVILYGLNTVIFGSSNWTSPSAAGQLEHNIFTTKPYIFSWFAQQFGRKWHNWSGVQETTDFVPLPPDAPRSPSPATQSSRVGTTVTLKWYGGPWAHLYDIYLGTATNPTTLIASNLPLGPSESATHFQSYEIPATLSGGTTYYWKVVGKTMALQERASAIWSFSTDGAAGPVGPATPVSPIAIASPSNPTFTWNAVSTASHYYLWINDSTGKRYATWFDRSAVGCPSGSGTCARTPFTPLKPGTITWWVQTWSAAGGYGPWSRGVTFTLQPLSTPTLLSPNGTAPNGSRIEFRWNRVAGATHHYLWVNDGSGAATVRSWYDLNGSNCASGSTCSVTLTPTLSTGTATWWIQAWNATTGYSRWSSGMQFTRN
jgi:phosphatidylserine/phosphatidylglycerophosphate/cardiolipin synthase-like enzyme